MHPFAFNAPTAQQRVHPSSTAMPAARCVIQMTVDTGVVTLLRAIAMRVCGDDLVFMRIAACAPGKRMKVWLCVGKPAVAALMDAVMAHLPGAEFGKIAATADHAPTRRSMQ